MNCSTYLIYSPDNDQSLVIAAFLRKYFPASYIIGVSLQKETRLVGKKYYDEIIGFDQAGALKKCGIKIPTGAFATRYLLEKGDVFLGSVVLTQSTLQVFDKTWMLSQAVKAGIVIPETWYTLGADIRYPLFYKERYEQGGGVRGVAFSEKDIPREAQENLLFQELINGSGTYGVGFLATEGDILTTYTHFERESFPQTGGSAVVIEWFEDARLLDYTARLVKYLNYSGWGLAEFKYCPAREDYVFMEINAKFWSSCELTFANQPLFLRLLFNIDSREKNTQKIFFVHRALSCGFLTFLRSLRYFFGDVKIRSYSKFSRILILSLIPFKILKIIKKTISWFKH